MSDPDDVWPSPHYNPGPEKHLHALGVIAITFANFQAGMDALYVQRASKENLPPEIVTIYYFSLSEDKRLVALKALFDKYERNTRIKDLVYNLIAYFEWCQHCRNSLLHAELYPPALGGLPDTLYLTKKRSKGSSTTVYIRLTLKEMRNIADNIRKGVVQCAELRINIRFIDVQKDQIPSEYRTYVASLPKTLLVPRFLELALHP